MKNKYCKHSRISEHQFRKILKCFSRDLTLTDIAEIVGVSRPAVSRIVHSLRERILTWLKGEPSFQGEVEIDESYFGPKRIRGKRGRGAGEKILVLGVLKRNGKVHTQIIPKATKANIMPILKGKILEESTVYTDGWKSYDGLIDLKRLRHYRVYHSKDEFARGKTHINGIESFWSYCKRRMRKQNGVRKNKFLLHLKESEWRWNYRNKDIYKILLKKLRENPL